MPIASQCGKDKKFWNRKLKREISWNKRGGCEKYGYKTKPAAFLCASHPFGIQVVNFCVEMPDQIKKERIELSHRIVDKNPKQMHPVPVWSDC